LCAQEKIFLVLPHCNSAGQRRPPASETIAFLHIKSDPTSQLISEDSLNALGCSLLDKKRFADAILILRINTEAHPKSTNTWDSLADAYSRSGDMPSAVENYRQALSIDPKYVNSDTANKFIADHAPKP
jgi:Tfp pilus assembly protein PilF